MKLVRCIAVVAASLVGAPLAGAPLALGQVLPGPPDPVEGHRLALEICAPCHVVASDQEQAPLSRRPGPSFLAIANRLGTTEASVRRFLATTHSTMRPTYSMPNPDLAEYQTNAIVAYILSLKGQHRAIPLTSGKH